MQQADSPSRIQNRWTVKTWTGTVGRALKTPGVRLLACPTLTLPPRLSRRASAGPGPTGKSSVGTKLRPAAPPPSPASTKPDSVRKTSPSSLRARLPVGRTAGCGGQPRESLGQAAEPAALQGHGGASCEAGAGETTLSHPAASPARCQGCGQAAFTLSILSLPARLAPRPAARLLLPLLQLRAGYSRSVEPRFQLWHK